MNKQNLKGKKNNCEQDKENKVTDFTMVKLFSEPYKDSG